MSNKYYLLSFCVCITSFSHLKAQSETCPFRASGNITNGINAELIRTDSGNLLGIRVLWSWLSSEPTHCFQSPKVELSTNTERIRRTLSSISRNNSVEFLNLDCNVMYTPIVKVTLGGQVQLFENGNSLFLGGSRISPPSVLLKVCIGPPTSLADQIQDRFNISWDPLPCHLQNGANISGYIIQYTQLSTGVATNISSNHRALLCSQESGGPHSCRVANSLLNFNEMYSFQVAARNNFGDGSFSNPITESIPITQGAVTCTESDRDFDPVVTSTTSTVLEGTDYSTVVADSTTIASSNTTMTVLIKDCSGDCTCQEVWTLMGSLVAVILGMAGIVIVVQFIINFVLWKRLRSIKKDQTLILPQTNTLHEKMDMKECSAYGQVISPQPVTEQPHIYEATT